MILLADVKSGLSLAHLCVALYILSDNRRSAVIPRRAVPIKLGRIQVFIVLDSLIGRCRNKAIGTADRRSETGRICDSLMTRSACVAKAENTEISSTENVAVVRYLIGSSPAVNAVVAADRSSRFAFDVDVAVVQVAVRPNFVARRRRLLPVLRRRRCTPSPDTRQLLPRKPVLVELIFWMCGGWCDGGGRDATGTATAR